MIEIAFNETIEGATPPPLFLREPCGEDELAELGHPLLLARLLDRLSVRADGETGGRRTADMTIAELDRAAAGLFTHLYGDLVICHVACPTCGERSEVRFSLEEFAAAVAREARWDGDAPPDLSGPDAEGRFRLGPRARFRLPLVSDLAAASAAGGARAREILRERCIIDCPEAEIDAVEQAMARVAPLLETDMDTACASCGAETMTPFGIAAFLAASMSRERPVIVREVHVIARAYGWSRDEILRMPRSSRREHVALSVADAMPAGSWP